MRRFFTRALVFVVAVASAGAALAQAPAPSEPPAIGIPPTIDVPPIVVVPPPSDGLLKVCKVGGPGIAPGTPFTVTAGASTFTVPSGPAPGGTCVVGPKFPVGTHVTVAETIPAGILVSSIAVAPSVRLDGAPNLAVGSANITIGSGVTEVTFTNKHTGFLEVCKTGEVQGNFSFAVNPGNLGPYVVPAGACSPAIEVAAGVVTIHELPSAGSAMAGCTTIPPAQQGACNLGAQISTVTIAPGDVSTMTIAFIANKRVTDAVDVSLDKKFASGPTRGTGAFTLTVKNEGAPIAPGTTIRITDPVPAGVTLTGFGGASGASWSCTPAFPVIGANTLTCTYTGSGTIASGALLPALVLNATLALAGSEIGIYSNCATVGLSTAAGSVTESNTANNRACAVTASINPLPCENGKCPQPVAACKQDVLMVIDASLSVTPNGLNTVKNAIARFLQPMQGKGRVNIFSFNNQPNWTPITTGGWTSVTSANWAALANPIMLGGTKTNWDDALERAKNVVAPNPPLVLFVTDGDPNASNDVNGAEVDNTNTPVTAATEAVQWINAIRGAGSPIIAIGFGQVANAGYIDAAFTGNVSGPGSINFETSSVIKMPSVNDLPAVMATLGNQMCGTLSLSKRTGGFSHPVPAGTTSFPVKDNIPFTLELTNNHATMQLTGVEVQDQVPAALSLVTVTAASSGTTFSPPPASNLIRWLIPTLPPRTTVTLNFTGTVNKPFAVPSSETYTNYAQVTAAQNYSATALNNMNPVSGPVVEVDEAVAAASVSVYVPSPPACDATPKPAFCYVQVSKVQNNPESCTPSVGGNCQYTVGVTLNSTNIPAGSTVTVADTFMVGTTPVSTPWSATVPASFCSGGAQTAVPFTCNHGSLTSFSGVMSATIPPGQNAQLKNCITVTVANMANTTPPTVSATACAP
jgi:uncharacterized repeat protein (TIGR01451 family)